MLTVAVVDRRPFMRAGVSVALEAAGLDVVAVSGDAARADVDRPHPDAVVVGVSGDDSLRSMVGIAAAGRSPVVALVRDDAVASWRAALEAGCQGVLIESIGTEQLVDAVRTVATGGWVVHPTIAVQLLPGGETSSTPVVGPLSDREQAVLLRVAEGQTNDEIAAALGVATSTVKTYVMRLFAKLGVSDRAHAVTLAFRNGLLR